jgi:amylosucrase
MPQVFPETAPGNFTYNEEMGRWVMTVFNNYQWDLNYTNPEVLIEMIDVILFLANQGIDVIRLDALAFMWKRIGTDSQNLEEAHILVQTMKACAQIVTPGTIFLAEAIVAPHEIVRYFGHTRTVSNECDIAYNATLMTLLWDTVATKSNKLISVSLDHIPRKPRGTTWLNYVRCHDDIGLGYEDHHAQMAGYDGWTHRGFLTNFLTGRIDWSFARGLPFMEDKSNGTARISGSLASLVGLERAIYENNDVARDLAIKRIIMLHSIIISFGGIPLLYAGDELATLNDYTFREHAAHKDDNRWVHRPKMDWKRAEQRNKQGTVEHTVFQSLKQLLEVRRSSPEFADNDNCHLINCHNEHLFGYMRLSDKEKTFAVANLNDHPETVYLDLMINLGFDMRAGVRDKVSNKVIDFSNYELRLEPYEFYWITQQ